MFMKTLETLYRISTKKYFIWITVKKKKKGRKKERKNYLN